jgi:LPXTG-motif cell wall-anchored protein
LTQHCAGALIIAYLNTPEYIGKEQTMEIWKKWEQTPQWVQVTTYTILGIAAIGGVGYLGFRLVQRLLQGTGAQSLNIWPVLGGLTLVGIVFGGLGRGRRRRDKRRGSGSNSK